MKLQSKDTDEVEIDMSPMIDMVFLLLVFFVVSAQVVDEKPKVTIPRAATAKLPEEIKDRLMISVAKDETLYFRQEKITFEQLPIVLQENFIPDAEMRVLIRADEEVPYKVSEKIMMACAEVGAINVIFAALEE